MKPAIIVSVISYQTSEIVRTDPKHLLDFANIVAQRKEYDAVFGFQLHVAGWLNELAVAHHDPDPDAVSETDIAQRLLEDGRRLENFGLDDLPGAVVDGMDAPDTGKRRAYIRIDGQGCDRSA